MRLTRIEDMTIDTFPVTEKNRGQYEVCKEMLTDPRLYRLVFFHLPSPEGLHMKYAIWNYWLKRDLFSAAVTDFANDLVAAVRAGQIPWNRKKYRNPEVLMLDDLQHLAGKEATQEELYLLLKQRLEAGKLTVLFSQFSLTQLRGSMRDELVDLLSMGAAED